MKMITGENMELLKKLADVLVECDESGIGFVSTVYGASIEIPYIAESGEQYSDWEDYEGVRDILAILKNVEVIE